MNRRRPGIHAKRRTRRSWVKGVEGDSGRVPLERLPEWVRLRTKLLEALEPYPEAKRAVIEAIRNL